MSLQSNAQVISIDLPYFEDMSVYRHSIGKGKERLLILESADIDTKENLKSFMIIDSALEISCDQGIVKLEPLSNMGELALQVLEEKSSLAYQSQGSVLSYVPEVMGQSHLTEDQRLQIDNVLTPLAHIQKYLPVKESNRDGVFIGGLFGFELIENFENFRPIKKDESSKQYVMLLAETLLIVDHERKSARIQANVLADAEDQRCYFDLSRRIKRYQDEMASAQLIKPPEFKMSEVILDSVKENYSDQEYVQMVLDLKEHIKDGDVFQVVPSRKFRIPCKDAFRAYKILKDQNPGPYMFYYKTTDFELFGSSPETSLKFDPKDRSLMMCPIAGTRRRGRGADGKVDFDLDSKIELELKSDLKENAEHIMLVDLARNDMARVSEPGTRYIEELLTVHKYSQVMHLVSVVKSQLSEHLHPLQAFQSCMLMGTLTGAPKIRAIELLRDKEQLTRGPYGGSIGYLTGKGEMDTCIVIRSALVEQGVATVQAGAGVVYDSVPEAEADETKAKASAVLRAIALAQGEV